MDPSDVDQQLAGLAGLGDPIRRALYRHVADRGVPVSREEAAQAALNRAAATLGAELGTEAATRTQPDGDPDQVLAAVRQVLAARGYEPYDDADGIIDVYLGVTSIFC